MLRTGQWLSKLLGTGLLIGAVGALGCGDSTADEPVGDNPDDLRGSSATGLLRAANCGDLLTKIQNDAVMKLKLAAELYKTRGPEYLTGVGVGRDEGGPLPGAAPPDDGDFAGEAPPSDPAAPSPSGPSTGGDQGSGGENSGDGNEEPTGASDTNTQVEGVDEADFVKVVDSGKGMFLLHGNALRRLTTWPAAETALSAASLTIEGSPSEMFVTDAGKAVIFSSVYGYGHPPAGVAVDYCGPNWCGYPGFTKITIADVSGETFTAERELYYQGSYVSSRRYAGQDSDVVRVVMQAASAYNDLYYPTGVQWTDAWGRQLSDEEIAAQIDAWVARTEASIRNTQLTDWLPLVQEVQGGQLVDVAPACDGYYVPQAGLSEYGLTHVLSLDVAQPSAPIGGVTIMGSTSTVYSNHEHLVLAQPDYRWLDQRLDFGFVDQQRTALHMFSLNGANTSYLASGWVPGQLPGHNPQFAMDESQGTLRIATTGWVRTNPDAAPESPDFWVTQPENHVFTAQVKDGSLQVVGQTENLGHVNETVQSARFVGDRGYVVTFRQTDPLIVVDVATPETPSVLGEIEIPGFSQYMHPLDANHLITLGQNATWGIQLQLFDVTDPTNLPAPKVLDFGEGTSSEVSYQHKAFTFFAEQGLLALPLYGRIDDARSGYSAALQVIKVSTAGFDLVGSVNHAPYYTEQPCGGVCDASGCYEYYCGYQPEVRRGHFVSSEDATYVYSFSYAAVVVNDVADLATSVASVTLPEPAWNDVDSWYGNTGTGGVKPGDVGRPPIATPPSMGGSDPAPEPNPVPPAQDAGSAMTPVEQDAGVDG